MSDRILGLKACITSEKHLIFKMKVDTTFFLIIVIAIMAKKVVAKYLLVDIDPTKTDGKYLT